MSDIERFHIQCWSLNKRENGHWVRYDDHRAEVERLKEQVGALTLAVEQADEAKAHAEAAAAAEEAETDRVMSERDAAQAEVERLTQELEGRRATNQRIIAERDLAQGERERLQDLLTCERQELSTLRERLRQPRRDQSAQNLDMVNGQAILDSSRPDDETIWREAFMRQLHDDHVPNWATTADVALAEYRKRWPR